MITAIHTLIYSDDPVGTRAFVRDVLEWPFVEHAESEPGWLIFKIGPSEMGVHPTSGEWNGKNFSNPIHHSISLMGDDVEKTVASLTAKGAQFNGEIVDHGFGLGIDMVLPGAGTIMLYQPMHPKAYDL